MQRIGSTSDVPTVIQRMPSDSEKRAIAEASKQMKQRPPRVGHISIEQSAEQTRRGVRYKPPKSGRARTVAMGATVAMKAKFAGEGDEAADEGKSEPCVKTERAALDGDLIKQLPRAEVAKLVRAWVKASPEAKREFIRQRWDEIARARKQLDANGAGHEDRWMESDTL